MSHLLAKTVRALESRLESCARQRAESSASSLRSKSALGRLRRGLSTARSLGFSLVEILLVILIILMLAGALVVYVLPQQEGAQRNTTEIKLRDIAKALDIYKLNIGTYPTEDQGGLRALVEKPTFENEQLNLKWKPTLARGTTLDDAWGFPLVYELVDRTLVDDPTAPPFRLFSVGPDGVRDTDDDVPLHPQTEPGASPTTPGPIPGG
ncbi:MAG TPA: type II secretion system protein GspG, partial [Planctomycetota bacterium]|nr:type II secretion system protein GspG [Planctomycetota bacterium]